MQALSGECGFMAANLYSKSIFGEDALANVSLERSQDMNGPTLTGHVRIRAKSQVIVGRQFQCFCCERSLVLQGMALSMGEKITVAQKQVGKESKARVEE